MALPFPQSVQALLLETHVEARCWLAAPSERGLVSDGAIKPLPAVFGH